ncbi:hypothetical protein [Streptomyces sp. NPDC001508]|uniref:hypothetical protein n=1 Tax=Streptomyces sp. NPDC001508 TaxID=3154656 RepID=UPI00331CE68A
MSAETTEQTAPNDPRASYMRARSLADRIIASVKDLPDSTETRREPGTDIFGVRLHFGTGLTAGLAVLNTAALLDSEPVREDEETRTWIEVRTHTDGIPVIARALASREDADQLLQQIPAVVLVTPPGGSSLSMQPVPLASSVVARVPAVIPTPADTVGGGQ